MCKSKKLGQNFLINENIIKKIILSIDIKKNDEIIEIGPGKAALTKYIICKNLNLVEIDTELIIFLKKNFLNKNVYEDDFLKFNINNMYNKKKLRIIGNIPYKISTKIVLHLIKFKNQIKDIHIMMQKELFERIHAKTQSKQYGKLSILIQYHFKIKKLFNVSKKAFKPQPKVDSIFIKLTPKRVKNIKNFFVFKHILNIAFSQRRKKLGKTLKNHNITILNINNILNKRPEEIKIEEYIHISNKYYKNICHSGNTNVFPEFCKN